MRSSGRRVVLQPRRERCGNRRLAPTPREHRSDAHNRNGRRQGSRHCPHRLRAGPKDPRCRSERTAIPTPEPTEARGHEPSAATLSRAHGIRLSPLPLVLVSPEDRAMEELANHANAMPARRVLHHQHHRSGSSTTTVQLCDTAIGRHRVHGSWGYSSAGWHLAKHAQVAIGPQTGHVEASAWGGEMPAGGWPLDHSVCSVLAVGHIYPWIQAVARRRALLRCQPCTPPAGRSRHHARVTPGTGPASRGSPRRSTSISGGAGAGTGHQIGISLRWTVAMHGAGGL